MGEHQNPILSIRTDSNSSTGYGHIMRCLAVSEELTKLGVSVRFVLGPDSDREPVERKGYNVTILKDSGLATDELLKLLNPNDDPLLFDSYDVSERDLEIFRSNDVQINQEDVNHQLMEGARRHPAREQEIMEYYRQYPRSHGYR